MRTSLALLLLLTASVAQDEANDLFQRAFRAEHIAGDAALAEKLYAKVVEDFPKSDVAPRALLGLIRSCAARGEEVAPLVVRLEKDYPGCHVEIGLARAIAEAGKGGFDPGKTDTPVDQMLNGFWSTIFVNDLTKTEEDLLADLGPKGHPMLRSALRVTDYKPVWRAAKALMAQRTPEAHAVVAEALRDPKVVAKSAVVNALGLFEAPPPVVDALARLYGSAPPRLRGGIVTDLVNALEGGLDPKGEAIAFEVLARALDDEDAEVRQIAYGVEREDAPDAYVQGVLKRMEEGRDDFETSTLQMLFHWADRPGVADRAEKVLGGKYTGILQISPQHAEGRMLQARVIARLLGKYSSRAQHMGFAVRQASASGAAAAFLLEVALERGLPEMVDWVTSSIGSDRDRHQELLASGGDRLRRLALDASYRDDDNSLDAAGQILGLVGLHSEHYGQVVEAAKKNAAKGLPAAALDWSFLGPLGPEKAGQLVEHCRGQQQFDALLGAGVKFAGRDDRGLAFFEAIIPRTGPGASKDLASIATWDPRLAALVGAHVLESKDPGWGWSMPDGRRDRSRSGPKLIDDEPIREALRNDRLLELTDDPRQEVAGEALAYAATLGDPGTAALVRALRSPWRELREYAIKHLAGRGAPAAEGLVAHLRRDDLDDAEKYRGLRTLETCGPSGAPFLATYLAKRVDDPDPAAWRAYFAVAPEAAVDLALAEVSGKGGKNYRTGALVVLTMTEDPRRLDVFRSVLRGETDLDSRIVLRTVGSQYVIELAEEVLHHLRNPDPSIRVAAQQAVEALKFYAEAKRAFTPARPESR